MRNKLPFAYENVPWMEKASCRDIAVNPDWFFPDGVSERSPEMSLALSICNNCTVRAECLEYALEHYPIYGIWGGFKPNEIKILAKKRKEYERSDNY